LPNFNVNKDISDYIRGQICFERFDTLDDLKKRCDQLEIIIYALEIGETSADITSVLEEGGVSPFNVSSGGGVGIMPGNEGSGLSGRQRSISDQFIFVPQYGSGTASLNVAVATSLALYLCPPPSSTSIDNDDCKEEEKES